MNSTFITLIVTLIAGLIGIYFYPYYSVTPGVLITGHLNLENDCFACHSLGRGATTENCIACHSLSSIGKTTVAGANLTKISTKNHLIHRSIPNIECYYCHTEHHGRSKETATLKFTHEILADSVQKNCASCHVRPIDSIHKGLQTTGISTIACGACHATKGWKPATFDHTKHFRFDKNHPSRCADCHTLTAGFTKYTCYTCHEHSKDRIAAQHQEERIQNYEQCVQCHRSGNADEIIGKQKLTKNKSEKHEREDD